MFVYFLFHIHSLTHHVSFYFFLFFLQSLRKINRNFDFPFSTFSFSFSFLETHSIRLWIVCIFAPKCQFWIGFLFTLFDGRTLDFFMLSCKYKLFECLNWIFFPAKNNNKNESPLSFRVSVIKFSFFFFLLSRESWISVKFWDATSCYYYYYYYYIKIDNNKWCSITICLIIHCIFDFQIKNEQRVRFAARPMWSRPYVVERQNFISKKNIQTRWSTTKKWELYPFSLANPATSNVWQCWINWQGCISLSFSVDHRDLCDGVDLCCPWPWCHYRRLQYFLSPYYLLTVYYFLSKIENSQLDFLWRINEYLHEMEKKCLIENELIV